MWIDLARDDVAFVVDCDIDCFSILGRGAAPYSLFVFGQRRHRGKARCDHAVPRLGLRKAVCPLRWGSFIDSGGSEDVRLTIFEKDRFVDPSEVVGTGLSKEPRYNGRTADRFRFQPPRFGDCPVETLNELDYRSVAALLVTMPGDAVTQLIVTELQMGDGGRRDASSFIVAEQQLRDGKA
jgi:hypothetical protein